ncbi:roadblock/LC7 domain-containing protein [Dichelobacter nodosus]|uniref:Roadblock/LAMTOR2 domain-containing protein n=1 Tax=Dichelobacter nodosus (strain VCS1703A) TaxID=246195 RepID=A5EWM5_DICNV|nr:roadblock/LC7 domain-containing protein [Dichelobacter nodosus]ABQ13504.1 hypothetical protein DNO_0145 [Dichelobacter nodosus VCS1703A]AXM45073.1 roadblock/LC7 domain-containing protein [Dichelobacter nodosus]KNZ39758.1 hypothetical protein AKG33_02805 [Dichelobacter nodosus]TGA65920.1 roadblock/LC7 domain-containing protein [Dichelobacter nodosus]
MATLEDYREKAFVNYCKAALTTFVEETPGVEAVLISTLDGFEITACSRDRDNTESVANLAAVGSSLFALGSSLATQFDLGASRSITIDNEKGKVYIQSISGGENNTLILMLESDQQAMLAHILYGSKKLSDSIGKRLSLMR